MQCPRCGYVFEPFEQSCSRCATLRHVPPTASFSSSRQIPAPIVPDRRRQARPRELPFGLVAGGLACVLVLIVGVCLFAPAGKSKAAHGVSIGRSFDGGGTASNGGPNLLLFSSPALPGSASLSGRSAVNSDQIAQRLTSASASVGGDLEVSLAWNTLSDLDLQVRDPSGQLITAEFPRAASGGVQDVDANPTLINSEGRRLVEAGRNPGTQNVLPLPEMMVDLDEKIGGREGLPAGLSGLFGMSEGGKAPSHYTHRPIEHIYFAHAPQGTYTVYAHCYSWRELNSTPLPFTIQIRSRGKVFYETSGTLGPSNYVADNTAPTQVCQFAVR